MIEVAVALLIVCAAAIYWYARLFPQGWGRLRTAVGLSAPQPTISKGCGGCSGCDRSGKGGCH
ncbi:hypothetical protein [Gluconobacter sphaericus]|uniref:Uncharacterized protein n=1 Tax=Gluconobacter sphaericus NBRC 12467 TaxID=1307951 RepID=A0AA37SFH5_9PROT|nr:hypothetical protein [Gluconobacter sphaericus]MBF0885041.1 hypothetical protein [Gluconobacter sphaericus]MBS1085492.1 hypothetical protein [Gluconobacter sphaericus]MBS1099115.1 hypothetical protein [Gluconobacter sphaericus]GBR51446.1 hypothetical protein AA12467_0607 [Gluconobacter sphaericus NBRC 12467]GEB41844.1 hypothetical protein GSP01_06260 [Gluconobacter sphaericus NBRC 12467]